MKFLAGSQKIGIISTESKEGMRVVPCSSEIAIRITDLNKGYGPFQVLRDVSMTVQKGERIELARFV